MKVAIISIKPAAKSNGSEVRNYYLYQGLKNSFDVSYLLPHLPDTLPEENLISRFILLAQKKVPYIEYNRQGYFDQTELSKIFEADIIQLQELESYFVIEKYLPHIKAKIVLDAHNVEYHRFISNIETSSFLFKLIGQYVSLKIKKLEIEALKKVNYVLACSTIDKKYFSQFISPDQIKVVPNGVEINTRNKDVTDKNNLLFMGLLSYGPNSDAIQYYLEEIHPLVKKDVNDVTFTVIGKNPPTWLVQRSEQDSSIYVKGFVENIQKEFDNAIICICPLRYGSGTRLKILEYMAAGKAIVSTSKGVEGLDIKPSEHLLIANSPKDFAKNITLLIRDKMQREKMGSNAYNLVKEQYDWVKITKNLCKFYTSIV